MEKITLNLRDQFCWQIERATAHGLMRMGENLRNDLKYRIDMKEKLECIQLKIIEVRNQLEGSVYNNQFSPDAIDNNLAECLGNHFDTYSMAEATYVVYSGSIELGKYDYNRQTKVLTVRPLSYLQHGEDLGFAFSYLDVFKPLIAHIQLCLFFLELIRLDKDFREKIKAEESKLLLTSSLEKENVNNAEIYLDYSDNSRVERIVFLNELGILDYLQKIMNDKFHGCSINKLAEVVSTFTNVGQGTVQSYLNSMFSNTVNPKRSQFTSKCLENVKNKLMGIGFNTTN